VREPVLCRRSSRRRTSVSKDVIRRVDEEGGPAGDANVVAVAFDG